MNGCKVSGCADDTIPASELKNGQIAVIVRNYSSSTFNGRIVQRHQYGCTDNLAVFGFDTYWAAVSTLTGDKCRVRVLKAGEAITVC